jgi:hypothetical protein
MAMAKSTVYFLMFVAIIIALSLLANTRQTGFFSAEAANIVIDGDFSDWQSVLSDSSAVVYDGPWNNMTDLDVVQWDGRNLVRFAFAQDANYLYFYFERVVGHESVDFFVYIDANGNGLMETGEPLVNFNWAKDSGSYVMSYYNYFASNPSGDDIENCGDGCTMPGDNKWGQNNVERLTGTNSSYISLETRFAKSFANITGGNLKFHISSALGQNVPNQIVDNMGPYATTKDTTPATIHYVNATPEMIVVGQLVNFTTKVTDNVAVSSVLIEISGTNYTMTKDGGDIWYYLWNATSAGNYTVTVWANDTSNNWGHMSKSFTVYSPALAIALSNDLAAGADWNVTTLPSYNYSANDNNGSGITSYYVIVEAIGLNADLYVKADGNLVAGNDSILLANEKLSFNVTDSTVPSSAKKSLTANFTDNQIGYNTTNSTKSWLKFFLDVLSGQSPGDYNNTLTFKVVQTGYTP